jgi:hypothetical protein
MTGSHTAAAMRHAMESPRDAFTSMSERAGVMTAKMAGAHHRMASRNVRGAAEGYAATHKVNSPPAEAPAEAAKGPEANRHSEADSDSDHYTDGNGRHYKRWVGDK